MWPCAIKHDTWSLPSIPAKHSFLLSSERASAITETVSNLWSLAGIGAAAAGRGRQPIVML